MHTHSNLGMHMYVIHRGRRDGDNLLILKVNSFRLGFLGTPEPGRIYKLNQTLTEIPANPSRREAITLVILWLLSL